MKKIRSTGRIRLCTLAVALSMATACFAWSTHYNDYNGTGYDAYDIGNNSVSTYGYGYADEGEWSMYAYPNWGYASGTYNATFIESKISPELPDIEAGTYLGGSRGNATNGIWMS